MQVLIATLTLAVACLQKSEPELLDRRGQNPNVFNSELLRKLKQTPHGSPLARQQKMATFLHRHILRLSIEVDTNIPSWGERDVLELKHFSDNT